MASLASINILFKANLKEFSSEMQNAKRELESTGKSFQSIGNKLSLAISVPVLAAGAASFKFGSDYQESLNKVEVAFKDTAVEVKAFAKTSLDQFGIAEGSALDMAALFGDMATSMGLSTAEASKMSTSLVGLAGDLASFKNIGIDQATTALNGVFTGETESLKTLGIILTEANLQQFAYSKGLKAKIKDMTQAEKVQLRYAYVMAQTTNAQGDFARTSDGAANQTRIFLESLKEMAANFGQIILPAVTKVISKLNALVKSFGQLSSSTKTLIVGTAALAAAVGPLLSAYGSILAFIPKIASGYATLRTSSIGLAVAQQAVRLQTLAVTAAQNIAMAGSQLFAAAQMLLTGNTIGASQAMNVFKASLIATPWGVVIAAVAAVGIAYAILSQDVKKMTASQVEAAKYQKLNNDINEQASQIIVNQRAKLEGLLATAKNKYLSDVERKNAIKEINALSPKFLGNITLEGIETDKTRIAVDKYTEALLRGAKARAAQAKLDEFFKKQIENEFKAMKASEENAKIREGWKKDVADSNILQKERESILKNEGSTLAWLKKMGNDKNQKEIDFLQKIINDNKEYLSLLESIGVAENASGTAGPKKGTIEYYQSLIKAQQEIQDKLSTTNESFAIAEGKIQEYQKAIDKISGKRAEINPIDTSNLKKGSKDTVEFFESQISELQRWQSTVATSSVMWQAFQKLILDNELKIALIVDEGSFDSANTAIRGFGDNFKEVNKKFLEDQEAMAAFQKAAVEGINNAYADLSAGLVESLDLADKGMQGFAKGMITTVTKLIGVLLAQSMANSIAGATAAGAATLAASPFTTPAFIATAVAGVIAAFASIPKFETGGIVGGSSYYGDKILARVNSGELILNGQQQQKLMGMIDPAGTNVSIMLDGAFKINGNDLELILDRVAKRNNRIK